MGQKQIERRQRAFELWRRLGSLSAVAKVPGMPPIQTLSKWKKQDKWEERRNEIQDLVRSQVEVLDEIKKSLSAEEDVKQLNFLRYLEMKVADVIIKGKVDIQTWRDVLETIRLIQNEKRLILGEPTQRSEVQLKIRDMSDEELEEQIKRKELILKAVGRK